MHFRSVSFRERAKLALRYIPTRTLSRVLDVGRTCNLAVALYNRGLVVHVILGRDGGRHLRHHYSSRQAIRGQAEITLDTIVCKFQIIHIMRYRLRQTHKIITFLHSYHWIIIL